MGRHRQSSSFCLQNEDAEARIPACSTQRFLRPSTASTHQVSFPLQPQDFEEHIPTHFGHRLTSPVLPYFLSGLALIEGDDNALEGDLEGCGGVHQERLGMA